MRVLRCTMVCFAILIAVAIPALGHWGKNNNKPFVSLAVATCMKAPLETLCQKFNKTSDYRCKLTFAPTGHLYAHVMGGVAYDILLSADETYTQGLINAKKADSDSRFVLATGRIVLWSKEAEDPTAGSLQQALVNHKNLSIAMPNPGLSTYGGAAKEVLQKYQLWNHIQERLIYGRNSKHTYDLVENKQVALGFVPLSALSGSARELKQYWEPDPASYKPVQHECLLLKPALHREATLAFLAFLRSRESCQVLQEAGYSCAV